MFLTRIGDDTQVIINGDVSQTDLRETSGLRTVIHLVKSRMMPIPIVEFGLDDSRSGICAEWVRGLRGSPRLTRKAKPVRSSGGRRPRCPHEPAGDGVSLRPPSAAAANPKQPLRHEQRRRVGDEPGGAECGQHRQIAKAWQRRHKPVDEGQAAERAAGEHGRRPPAPRRR